MWISVLILGSSTAQAYVVSLKDSGFGAYLKGSYSPWSNGQDIFGNSSGNNMSFNGSSSFIPSGEFGFLFSSQRLTWKLGFEFLPIPTQNLTGSSRISTAALYNLSSNASAVNPKLGFEFNLKSWTNSRAWILAEVGESFIDIQNNYSFTTAGTTQFGLSNFTEEVKGQQLFYDAGIGFETILSDTTALEFDAGYRVLNYTTLTHNQAVTTFQGSVSSGTVATNNNGTNRSLNMSGAFAGVGFRFWIN